jgi:two-component system copper resistance phosphate regulon response regulator CusR
MMQILLVEDDPNLSAVIGNGLGERGNSVVTAATVRDGRARALERKADVIILDVGLPDGSGFDLCRELRRDRLDTPILMLTARESVQDRVDGLESGADDYLTKPFAFSELVARVAALGRRRPLLAPAVVQVADLSVNLKTRRIARGARDITLTAKEFALLEFFAAHVGEVVTRAEITAHVWDDNHDPFTNVLEVLIRRLRRKIDDGFDLKLIHTLRGAGYRFGT